MTDVFDSLINELQPKPKAIKSAVDIEPTEVMDDPDQLRLSLRDKVYRIVGGVEEELGEGPLKIVVVKAASISRIYYENEYINGETKPPTCWSSNANSGVPAKEVPQDKRQSTACFNCPQDIKGSGQGVSRACRFQQRIAVMLANEEGVLQPDQAYHLPLPATSVFGKDQKKMGLQTYARLIDAQGALLSSVMTEISFDKSSDIPKLCFRPFRVLEEEEIVLVKKVQSDPYTKTLVTSIPKLYVDNNLDMDDVFDVVEGEGVYVKDA